MAVGLCLWMQTASAEVVTGRVVGVADGDTITVLDAQNTPHKVRLAGIDAPESKQPFGARSKQSLSDLVAGQTVTVETDKRDRYGRLVGKVIVAGLDANLAQLHRGMAWFYRQYENELTSEDRRLYDEAETRARQQRTGLWTDPEPTPPWEWRRRGRATNQEN